MSSGCPGNSSIQCCWCPVRWSPAWNRGRRARNTHTPYNRKVMGGKAATGHSRSGWLQQDAQRHVKTLCCECGNSSGIASGEKGPHGIAYPQLSSSVHLKLCTHSQRSRPGCCVHLPIHQEDVLGADVDEVTRLRHQARHQAIRGPKRSLAAVERRWAAGGYDHILYGCDV
jgi:hypothetical protein